MKYQKSFKRQIEKLSKRETYLILFILFSAIFQTKGKRKPHKIPLPPSTLKSFSINFYEMSLLMVSGQYKCSPIHIFDAMK